MPLPDIPRLMLVEDNPHDVYLVREAIRAKRIAVDLVWFSDVPEALSALERTDFLPPHLIVLDLNLPSGDGWEVLDLVRSKHNLAHVPVAILTSSESPRDQQRAWNQRVNAYIVKPLGLDAFLENVGRAVETLLLPLAAQSR